MDVTLSFTICLHTLTCLFVCDCRYRRRGYLTSQLHVFVTREDILLLTLHLVSFLGLFTCGDIAVVSCGYSCVVKLSVISVEVIVYIQMRSCIFTDCLDTSSLETNYRHAIARLNTSTVDLRSESGIDNLIIRVIFDSSSILDGEQGILFPEYLYLITYKWRNLECAEFTVFEFFC